MLAQLEDDRSSLADAVTGLLAVAIVLGSAAMWIGIPLGGLWLAGEELSRRRASCSRPSAAFRSP